MEKTLDEKLAVEQQKIEKAKAKIRRLKKEDAEKERKKRTRLLIQAGAEVEFALRAMAEKKGVEFNGLTESDLKTLKDFLWLETKEGTGLVFPKYWDAVKKKEAHHEEGISFGTVEEKKELE